MEVRKPLDEHGCDLISYKYKMPVGLKDRGALRPTAHTTPSPFVQAVSQHGTRFKSPNVALFSV